eukprot:2797287-Lingulodinium_polyedra.AAC.1
MADCAGTPAAMGSRRAARPTGLTSKSGNADTTVPTSGPDAGRLIVAPAASSRHLRRKCSCIAADTTLAWVNSPGPPLS